MGILSASNCVKIGRMFEPPGKKSGESQRDFLNHVSCVALLLNLAICLGNMSYNLLTLMGCSTSCAEYKNIGQSDRRNKTATCVIIIDC